MKFLKWIFWFFLIFIGAPVSLFVFINLIYLLISSGADNARILQSVIYNIISFFLIILPLSWKFRQMKTAALNAQKKYTEIRLEDRKEELG